MVRGDGRWLGRVVGGWAAVMMRRTAVTPFESSKVLARHALIRAVDRPATLAEVRPQPRRA